MRVLVTGGAGFIGSHIVDALLDSGHEPRILDRLSTHVPDGVEHVRADVRDGDAVRRALSGIDAVSHQAARVGLGVDIADIADYSADNDLGTAVVLRELNAARFDGALVLASSMVVYGEGRYRCTGHGVVAPGPRTADALGVGQFEPACPECGAPLAPEAVGEEARVDPRNVYAATKLHQEHLCAAFGRETGVPVAALRYHNVYGPRLPRGTPYAGVAAIFLSSLAAGASPRVYEDGGQLRDFVHVRDVARANLLALEAAVPFSGPVNVCSGTPRSVGEMAAALCDAAGTDAPRPVVTGDFRLGDVRHVFACADRARDALGFSAAEDFAAGMRELSAESALINPS